jgi:hypothetical protein
MARVGLLEPKLVERSGGGGVIVLAPCLFAYREPLSFDLVVCCDMCPAAYLSLNFGVSFGTGNG